MAGIDVYVSPRRAAAQPAGSFTVLWPPPSWRRSKWLPTRRNLLAAARAARTLGWFHGSVYGEWAVYRGWIGRAVSLLEQAGANSNEHGWVLLAQTQAGSDLDDQKRLYLRAIEAARRCGNADLECDALASLGIMLAFSGYTSEGMARLDEALAVICAGDVEDLSVVEGVFCGLFHACERTNDVGRAEQWLCAADDYVRRRRFAARLAGTAAHTMEAS